MEGRARLFTIAATLLVAAGGAYAVLSRSGPLRASADGTPAHVTSSRETPRLGLVARLPYIGTLTWRCDDRQRFFTELRLPTPGASVSVGVTSDAEPVWRDRQVNPKPPPERTIVGPFRALERQTWTIRFHHKPATLSVVARLRFAAPRPEVECLVSHAAIEMRRTPH